MSAVLQAQEPSARYLTAEQPALVREFELLATAPGGVGRLRDLILTLAVQGKLVQQNSSDEPAHQLLETIAAEKDRQIASGRIKPDKPFKAPLDHCPFEIPKTWAWVPMGEVMEIVRGITFPASEKTKEAAPGRIACLRTANIQEAIEWDDLLFVSRSFMGRDDQLLEPHDIVMSMANSRELVGKVALVRHIPHPESTFGGFLGVLRPWKIDPRYAMALLRSSYARSSLIDSSSQTTNIANISLGKLRPLPFPLPPLAEQARIVARVDELMRLCDALEAQGRLEAEQHARLLGTLLGTLTDSSTPEALTANWQRVADHFDLLLDRPEAVDALEQTILQFAVRGLLVPQNPSDEPAAFLLNRLHSERARLLREGVIKKNPSVPPVDDEGPFPLPPGWEWARLGNLANFIDYRGKTPTKTATGVPLITAKNVRQGFINRDPREFIAETAFVGWMTRGMPRVGDLLFTTEAPLGNVAAIDIEERFALAQRVICFSLLEREMSSALLIFLLSPWMQSALTGQASGVTAQGIKSARLQLMPIPVPPIAEQRRIASRVWQLRRLCTDLRRRLAASQAAQSHLAEALVESATP